MMNSTGLANCHIANSALNGEIFNGRNEAQWRNVNLLGNTNISIVNILILADGPERGFTCNLIKDEVTL